MISKGWKDRDDLLTVTVTVKGDRRNPSYYKSPKIHCCSLCDYQTKKLSNIKNHLKGKHRKVVLPPGDSGFHTKNEKGEVLDYIPRKRRKNRNADGEDISEDLDVVRYHKCNYCSYESLKISNIKSHMFVHKYLDLPERDLGFQTLYRPETSIIVGEEDMEEEVDPLMDDAEVDDNDDQVQVLTMMDVKEEKINVFPEEEMESQVNYILNYCECRRMFLIIEFHSI